VNARGGKMLRTTGTRSAHPMVQRGVSTTGNGSVPAGKRAAATIVKGPAPYE
jgi:hypothetical protein